MRAGDARLARPVPRALYPVGWLLDGRFDAAAKVRRLNVPLLVIHGERDDLVPPLMGIALYVRASTKKSLLLVEGATRSDTASVDAEAYQAAFERLMPLSPSAPRRPQAAFGDQPGGLKR